MKVYPYFDAKPAYYEKLTEGMSEKAKQGFANALAHHMMPVMRTSKGWWMTRFDHLRDRPAKGYPLFDLLDNEGKWNYRVAFEGDEQ